jgi:transcriptional regulator with XRE-family HTH domain
MEFGYEIRRRRLALGMTLEQLAEASKLTPNYIGTIENGKRDPSLSTVMALAKGLRIAPAELFGGLQDLSAAATEAGLLFEGATSDVQEAVLQLLRSVSRRKKMAKAGAPKLPETPGALRDVG